VLPLAGRSSEKKKDIPEEVTVKVAAKFRIPAAHETNFVR
jgi:hypothetical protein